MTQTSLKQQLEAGGLVIAPGVYDGISTLVANESAATALYMTGYGVSASLLGQPDAGFLTSTHMADRVRMICAASDKPLIADADTGFGGVANVAEAVRAYEQAGVQAIQLEDQEFPKRCGHTKGCRVIDRNEAEAKIKAAAEARQSDDFLIVARTDARSSLGLEECFHRADAFLDAGANILFIESPQSVEEMQVIGERYRDNWLLANMVDGGNTPIVSANELQTLGFNLAIYPLYGLSATIDGLQQAYAALQNRAEKPAGSYPFNKLNTLVGLDPIQALNDE